MPGASPLSRTPVTARLAEFACLEAGWLDGEGVSFDPRGLQRLACAFDQGGVPTPHLYPSIDGSVRAEWSFNGWEASLEIQLPDLCAEYHALNLVDGTSREQPLNLGSDAPAAWGWLSSELGALSEAPR